MSLRTKTYEDGEERGNWKLSWNLSETPPKISQWFVSLEGEGSAIGTPSLYIRLAGCRSAHCSFCDTAFSQFSSNPGFKEINDPILNKDIQESLSETFIHRCTITGGEPLHFIREFHNIFKWIFDLSPTDINFLGIESNGNLLQHKEHCLDLIKAFNSIERDFGVSPVLTISPKLDAETCYDKQMTQGEVDEMYFETFQNIANYLQPHKVFYKFIYDYTEEIIDFEHQKLFIDFLIDKLKVPHNHILLMPFTPEDPLDKDSQFWLESKDATARKALKLAVNYSPRIHIDRKLD
jgi:hypothetical protein